MEDSVTEDERLLPHLNLSPEAGSKREQEKEDGFVSTEKEENRGEELRGKDCVDKDEAKGISGGGGGGLINNLISALVTPMSPRAGKATEHETGRVDNGGEGGLISNLLSNFFQEAEAQGLIENQKDKEEEEVMVDERIKRVKTETEANINGGGGIIHNILSHLPPSLPDDAVPTADEATFLINSLVRD